MNLDIKYWSWQKGLPSYFCKDVIKHGLKQEQKEAVTRETELGEVSLKTQHEHVRKNKVAWLEDPWIYDHVNHFIEDANLQAGWDFEYSKIETCQFTTYYGEDKNFYNWHVDMGTKPYTQGFCKGLIRKLSAVVLLNDPSEFEGGELQFDTRDIRDESIFTANLTESGSIVVFPSFLWHRVSPVVKGTRYSLVLWACGKKFK